MMRMLGSDGPPPMRRVALVLLLIWICACLLFLTVCWVSSHHYFNHFDYYGYYDN